MFVQTVHLSFLSWFVNALSERLLESRTVRKLNIFVTVVIQTGKNLQFCFLPPDGDHVLIKQHTDWVSSFWLAF